MLRHFSNVNRGFGTDYKRSKGVKYQMTVEKSKDYQIKILHGEDEVIALKLLPEPLREFWGWICALAAKKEKPDAKSDFS